MKYVYAIVAAILMSHVFCGCATIFNGSTQDVPVSVPEGTTITDLEQNSYPILTELYREDTIHYIQLRREQPVLLRFTYKDQKIISAIPRSIEPAWAIFEFLYIVPFIVDAATGAWNSYDGVRAVFDTMPHLEEFDDSKFHTKSGPMIQLGFGAIFPVTQAPLFFTSHQIGGGYHHRDKWVLQFVYTYGALIDFLVYNYNNGTQIRSFHLEGRYYPYGGLFLSGGGGVTNISGSILTESKNCGTGFAGIGYGGKTGYIEIRHTPWLTKISLPDGTKRGLTTTSLNFGLNLFF